MDGQRILIVGGGFAGLYAAMELREVARAGHRVTVVSAENFMQYQPFLPEVASGTIDPRAVVVPLRSVLPHVEVIVAEVRAIDHDARRAQALTPDGRELVVDYDEVVVTAGSWSRVLPVPGLADHGVGFKTIQEAIWLRNHVLSRLDLAADTSEPARRRTALTFVFVGAGYAGVEALGELEDLSRDALTSYPTLAATICGGCSWRRVRRSSPSCLRTWRATPRGSSPGGGSRYGSTRDSSRPRAAGFACPTARPSKPRRWCGRRG